MNADLIDITRPLGNATPPWPGDTAFDFRLAWQIAAGATVNVGALTMGTHNGTHADAPFHFQPGGAGIDAVPLSAFIGPAVVADVTVGAEITRDDLEPLADAIRECRRLLLKTDAWRDPARFPLTIPVLAPDVPEWLGDLGVVLLGLDVPSVDAIDSSDLGNHHALAEAGVSILESLDLSRVDPGVYELIALPLKILGADASPVRAILRRLQA